MLLVTGASGLLGASVLLRARDMGQEVAGVSRRHALQVPGTVAHCVDLADQAATRRIIEHLQPTSVIHCAAATNVDWCEDHPEQAHRINTLASSFLAALGRPELAAIAAMLDEKIDGVMRVIQKKDTVIRLDRRRRGRSSAAAGPPPAGFLPVGFPPVGLPPAAARGAGAVAVAARSAVPAHPWP